MNLSLKNRVINILLFLTILFSSFVLCIISAIFISKILGHTLSYLDKILITWISMGTFYILGPYLFLHKKYKISLQNLGLKKVTRIQLIFCLIILIGTYLYIFIGTKMTLYYCIIITLQNLGIAFSEEFFTKGIMFFQIGKIVDNSYFKILLSALIFAFLFHNTGSFFTNLLYRLPMGIALGYTYIKTKNLYIPITLHFVNNILASSIH